MNQILIGTSGYDHPELKGSFYPEKLPRKDFLQYYSTQFNALEINSTFYGMPTAQRMLSFYERSEGRLHFSVKLTQTMTHQRTSLWQQEASSFMAAMEPLAERNVLSAVLIQFPESFHYTVENRIYLSNLLKALSPLPLVVEFRHREWIRQSVFSGLENHKAGIVFCDMPPLKNLPNGFLSETPFIGPNAYIRLHGRNENGWYVSQEAKSTDSRYSYAYSIEELKSFLPIIAQAQKEGRTVQLYFNNYPKGTGFSNALEMSSLCKQFL